MSLSEHPEVRLSDGTTGRFTAPEVIAERAATYASWVAKVTGPRPHGHQTIHTTATPLSWTPLRRPLAECTVALVTTGGAHLRTQPAFAIYDEAGDSSLRVIPGDTRTSDLTFSHTHYAVDDALADPNVMLPLDRLRELVALGRVGAVAPQHFGFMGFIPDPRHLVADVVPPLGRALREQGIDIAVLTPG